jgi:hypothetical protein
VLLAWPLRGVYTGINARTIVAPIKNIIKSRQHIATNGAAMKPPERGAGAGRGALYILVIEEYCSCDEMRSGIYYCK